MPSSNNTRRSNRPSHSPNPPPSSVYSQSQQSIPVSMLSAGSSPAGAGSGARRHPVSSLSTASGAAGSGAQRRPNPPPTHHSRPTSSAFFHVAAAPSAAGGNPFAQFQQPSAAHNNANNSNRYPGGFDGAFDDDLPHPRDAGGSASRQYSTSAPAGGFAGGLLNFFGRNEGKDKARAQPKESGSASSSKSSKSGNKSLKNHALKVDRSTLSTSAKMGIWLMGSSPKKLEKAALARQEKRRREREEKKMRRREERANGGARGANGEGYGDRYEGEGYGDDEEGEEGPQEW